MPSPLTNLTLGAEYRDVFLPASRQEATGEVTPAKIDLLVLRAAAGRQTQTGEARRAMERLALRHATSQEPIRVATLTPSGRPIALHDGDTIPLQVSASHAAGLIVATCRTGSAGVGVDLVDPATAGSGLDWWAETSGHADKSPAMRSHFWAAREAAYKAAQLDIPFAPAAIHVAMLSDEGFAWRIGTPSGPIAGRGRFFVAGQCLLAVAVEQQRVAVGMRADEVVLCS